MKYIIYLSLFLFFISCESSSDDDRISLNKSEITFDSSGGEEVIAIEANGEWRVDNVPEWITLDQSRRFTSSEVIVSVRRNDSRDRREAIISFVLRDQVTTLKVTQEKRELTWSNLGFSSVEDVKFIPNGDGNEGVVNFKLREMFINPESGSKYADKIFLGNLVNRSLENNLDVPVFSGYTFNDITVSPVWTSVKSAIYLPSKSNDEDFAKRVVESEPSQSVSFYSNGGSVFYTSHKELNLIGVSNMGVNLDEIISGQSYKNLEMEKKYGVIYSFQHILFSLVMDVQFDLVKEQLDKKDFPENSLSNISSVNYGRIGLLLIESDYDVDKVRSVANTILRDVQSVLTQEQESIAGELKACHIYYDNSRKLKVVKGTVDAIRSYGKQLTGGIYDVYPVSFSVSDCFTQGTGFINFSLKY